jgi:hypothetical protein
VAQDLETFGRARGNDLEVATAVQRRVEVYQLSVQLRHDGIPGEARADLLGDVSRPLARFYLQLFAIG